MVYGSALLTYGQGLGVVVATGDRSEIGRISGLIAEATDLETPLTRKIAKFSHALVGIIIGLWRTDLCRRGVARAAPRGHVSGRRGA